jgi:hypothetical protein
MASARGGIMGSGTVTLGDTTVALTLFKSSASSTRLSLL